MQDKDEVPVAMLVQQVMREYGFDGPEFANYSEELGIGEQGEGAINLLTLRKGRVVGCAAVKPKMKDNGRNICELRKCFCCQRRVVLVLAVVC